MEPGISFVFGRSSLPSSKMPFMRSLIFPRAKEYNGKFQVRTEKRRPYHLLTAAVPKEQPLESFTTLQLVGETKYILLVGEFEKIEQLRACLHHTEWGRLRVVDQYRNTTLPP